MSIAAHTPSVTALPARPPGGPRRGRISRWGLALVAVLVAAALPVAAQAEDGIPKGDLIPPLVETDAPRDVVLEMMDGRTLVGRFDPVRRIIKTSGAIKAELYVRNKDVRAWYLAVPESPKAISSPEVKPDGGKPILAADDPAWKAKVPPYRMNLLEAKEAGDYQKRFGLVALDASSFESWDVEKKGYYRDNPLVMIDGKEEDLWSFGYARNSVTFVLHEPVALSMIGIKFYGYRNWDDDLKSLQVVVNEGTAVEAANPKFDFCGDGTTLYVQFRQPSEFKSIKLTNLNGGVTNSGGISQIYFLRDRKLQKILDGN